MHLKCQPFATLHQGTIPLRDKKMSTCCVSYPRVSEMSINERSGEYCQAGVPPFTCFVVLLILTS